MASTSDGTECGRVLHQATSHRNGAGAVDSTAPRRRSSSVTAKPITGARMSGPLPAEHTPLRAGEQPSQSRTHARNVPRPMPGGRQALHPRSRQPSATPADIASLREAAGPELGLKAVGMIHTPAEAEALVAAGANRLGVFQIGGFLPA